jgi:carbonic anhydrase
MKTESAPLDPKGRERRNFVKTATAIGALGLISEAGLAYADAMTAERRALKTPEDVIAAMKRGNERFRSGTRKNRDYLREQKASAKGQFPVAILLSCIDSRAPAEVILDLGIGDIFNARVAGNIQNDDILGSMEFACKVAGAKVILVMGHTACGAIKGAIDHVELGNLTGLLAKIRPAVDATTYVGERTSKNPAFVDAVSRRNVELTIAQIPERSPVLKELQAAHTVLITGAMYNIETAVVEFFG